MIILLKLSLHENLVWADSADVFSHYIYAYVQIKQ